MDFTPEKRKGNGCDGERNKNFPVEMSGLVKAPERDAGDENVGGQHRDFGGRRRDTDERERGEITRRAAMPDGGIKECNRENAGNQDRPIRCGQVMHNLDFSAQRCERGTANPLCQTERHGKKTDALIGFNLNGIARPIFPDCVSWLTLVRRPTRGGCKII